MTQAPLLISVAPNGARRMKSDHPAIPLTPRELADEAVRCADAGARLFHLHVRKPDGGHSLEPADYLDALTAIGGAVADRLIVQITTEACGVYERAAQMRTVRDIRPEAASFAVREYFGEGADEAESASFFAWVHAAGIAAQFIVYTPAEVDLLKSLCTRGVLRDARPSVLFVLGLYLQDEDEDGASLAQFLAGWRDAGPWSVCAFGRREITIAAKVIALGGHVRVGFENNLRRPDGSLLASNAEQVAEVARQAEIVDRNLISIAGARALLGLGSTAPGASASPAAGVTSRAAHPD